MRTALNRMAGWCVAVAVATIAMTAGAATLTVNVSRGGELAERLGEKIRTVSKLVVEGQLNATDFETLYEASYLGYLEEIDLSSAKIEGNKVPDRAFYRYNLNNPPYVTVRLKKITLPNGLESIGEFAFCDAGCLEEVVLPETITVIEKLAFNDCSKLKKINFPASLTSIGQSAFERSGIEKAVFADGLRSVGPDAFSNCWSLREASLPNSVNYVSTGVFSHCIALESLTLPAKLWQLPNDLALRAYSLRDISIPAGVTTIGVSSLALCRRLRSINIPEGVLHIAERALIGLPHVTTLLLPSTLSTIGEECMAGLPGLKTIYCKAQEPPSFVESQFYDCTVADASAFEWVKPEREWMSTPADVRVYVPAGSAEKYRASSAWDKFSDFVEIDHFPTYEELVASQPQPVETTIVTTRAGELASRMADAGAPIASLTVRGPLNEADFNAMRHESLLGSLEKIDLSRATIADGAIPENAFYESLRRKVRSEYFPIGLREIALPTSVTQIGDSAFYCATCLETVVLPQSITSTGACAFGNCVNLTHGLEELPAALREVGYGAFYNCSGLTASSLPQSIESIDKVAFAYTSITNANLPENLAMLGKSAFLGCSMLKTATLPESLKTLPEYLFSGCGALESLVVPSGVTEIPRNFLYCAQNLKSLSIPDEVESFGYEALSYCRSLTSLTLPSKCSEYRKGVLEGCYNLRELVLPASVWSLQGRSLTGLGSLEKLYSKNPQPPYCLKFNNTVGPFGTLRFDEGIDINTPIDTPVFVPVGSAEAYRRAEGWNYFTNFIETDEFPEAGVDAVFAAGSALSVAAQPGLITISGASGPYAVYTPDGRLAAAGTLTSGGARQTLDPGLYIVATAAATAKVVVP